LTANRAPLATAFRCCDMASDAAGLGEADVVFACVGRTRWVLEERDWGGGGGGGGGGEG
jgi:glutamyl-tRNA reductase